MTVTTLLEANLSNLGLDPLQIREFVAYLSRARSPEAVAARLNLEIMRNFTRQGEDPNATTWYWDEGVSRYRNDVGQFISRSEVVDLLGQSLKTAENATDQLANMVSSGQLGAEEWKLAMQREIKDEYIREYMLGRGGTGMMNSSDWGSVGGMLKEQYRYLDGFAEQVKEGNLTEGQIAVRSNMYIDSALEGYERAHMRAAIEGGMDEEEWEFGATENHCEDCEEYAGMGWQPIGTFPFPGDGSTKCLTNCGCHKHYRNSSTGEEFED